MPKQCHNFKDTEDFPENEDQETQNEGTRYRRKNSNQMVVPIKRASHGTSSNTNFNFPDGGWVCSQCQNYNFSGRVKCNRCNKVKTKQDFNGKPKHLLKKCPNQQENTC